MAVRRAILALALAGAALVPSPASANGIGDLYAVAGSDVLELHVASDRVINSVPLPAAGRGLAFSPDGADLYAATAKGVVRIDIESISAAGVVNLPSPATALAHPTGDRLIAAMPGPKRLAIADFTAAGIKETAVLPGAPDLLASHRSAGWVLAAERGADWVAALADGGKLRTKRLTGAVQAISMGGDGTAYVVTRGPAKLYLLAPDLSPTRSMVLPDPPDAVAATAQGALVASGDDLAVVTSAGHVAGANTNAPVRGLFTSDAGDVVYVLEADRIEAFDPSGGLLATVHMERSDVTTLAAIPGPASVGGSGMGPEPTPDAATAAPWRSVDPRTSAAPHPTPTAVAPTDDPWGHNTPRPTPRMPSTDTLPGTDRPAPPSPMPALGLALLVGLGSLLALSAALRRWSC